MSQIKTDTGRGRLKLDRGEMLSSRLACDNGERRPEVDDEEPFVSKVRNRRRLYQR